VDEILPLPKADEIMKILDRHGIVVLRRNRAGKYVSTSAPPGTRAHKLLTKALDRCLGVFDDMEGDNLPGVTCCFGELPSEALFALAGEVRVAKAPRG
jgi:hypothetical protein